MNKIQKILLALTGINLAVVFLFPPFDDNSASFSGATFFAGFRFVFNQPANFSINSSLLYLEVAVVLINLGILWLLTTENVRREPRGKINFRKAAIALIAFNLIGVLLFPPFEYISNMSFGIIPTFEGFYFIFSHPPYRAIVIPVLYLEVFFILINGGLMLLAFKDDASQRAMAVEPAKAPANRKPTTKKPVTAKIVTKPATNVRSGAKKSPVPGESAPQKPKAKAAPKATTTKVKKP